MNQPAKTVTLFSQPYLDKYNQCYKNIVTINLMTIAVQKMVPT